MRKEIVLLMLIAILCITGCGKRNENVTGDLDDSKSEKKYNTLLFETDIIHNKDVEPYILKAGDKEYTLDYGSTLIDVHNDVINEYYCHLYDGGRNENISGTLRAQVDASTNELVCVDFYNLEFPYWEQKMVCESQEEALKLSKEIAGKYINIDEYVVDFYESSGYYIFNCVRYVDGMPSEEVFEVHLAGKEPGLIRITTNNIGDYKDVTLGDFKDDEAQSVALEKVKELHGDFEYNISRKDVCYMDGKLGVVYCYCDDIREFGQFVFVYLE